MMTSRERSTFKWKMVNEKLTTLIFKNIKIIQNKNLTLNFICIKRNLSVFKRKKKTFSSRKPSKKWRKLKKEEKK